MDILYLYQIVIKFYKGDELPPFNTPTELYQLFKSEIAKKTIHSFKR